MLIQYNIIQYICIKIIQYKIIQYNMSNAPHGYIDSCLLDTMILIYDVAQQFLSEDFLILAKWGYN